ncbi:MAG: diguanylate cyclase, partial [Synergistaceae bacterium]|nr:diguanylate cyclase [Synergistaceae bacterium]
MALKEEHSNQNIMSAVVIAVLIFIVSALIFMNIIYSSTKKQLFATMHDLERQNVLRIKQNLETNKNFVSSISINLGRMTGDLDSNEAINYVKGYSWFADFGTLYLIKRDGGMSFGKINSQAERNYYTDLISKNSSYSDIRVFNSETGSYLAINSPIRNHNETIGVLSAKLFRNRLNQLVTFNIFNGTGFCYLLSKDGSIIARSNHPIVNKKATTLDELFSASGRTEWKEDYTSIVDGMEKGTAGETIYPVKNGNRVVCYAPVEVAGMYLLTSVPENVVFTSATGYFLKGLLFVLICMANFAVFMCIFLRKMKKNNEIIRYSNRELSQVYDNMPGGIVRYVLDGKKWNMKSANKGFFKIIGYSEKVFAEKYENNFFNLISKPLSMGLKLSVLRKIQKYEPIETEMKMVAGDGSPRWVNFKVDYVKEDNCPKEMVVIFSDITNIKTANRELYVSKEQFDIVKRLTNVIFFEWNIETGIISPSSNFLDFFDPLDSYENFPYSIKDYSALCQEDAKALISLFEQFKAGLKESLVEVNAVNKFGDAVWYRAFMSTIFDESGKPVKVVGLLTDIDEQKKKLQSAEERASKDPLTQLYNKTSTKDLIESYISSTQSQGAFMMLDIDNFKLVNDTHGHLYGDAVLSELAHTLKSLFRDSDITGRFGGDEFVVFMTNVKETMVVQKKAESILKAFYRSFRKEGIEYGISCSIGISLYPWDGNTYEKLMRKADLSLYSSKNSGKNQYNFYSDSMDINDLSRNKGIWKTTEINAIHGFVQKNFRENVAEYILKLFSQYEDVDKAVPILLELVGKSFALGRIDVAVFSEDETYHEILYEWCDDGVYSIKVEGKGFVSDEWSLIKPHLNENNIVLCNDVERGVPDFLKKDDMCDRGVKSAMLCYIVEHDKRKAVLVFEHFRKKHIFTKEEMDTIRTISDTISLFVLRARERAQYDEKEAQMKNWELMLDETDEVVYVSDAEN